jgi:hypothetical protein
VDHAKRQAEPAHNDDRHQHPLGIETAEQHVIGWPNTRPLISGTRVQLPTTATMSP